jgi:hypothetical protein
MDPGVTADVPHPEEAGFETAVPAIPTREGGLLDALRRRTRGPGEASRRPHRPVSSVVMESGVSVIQELRDAPARTPRTRSSPLELLMRDMIETRSFGRSCDTIEIDLHGLDELLPPLECAGDSAAFYASGRSLEDLSLCVDALLVHRRRLVDRTVDRGLPRRHALVLGAGPGGLMTAIELRLRNHAVVVCESREVYTRSRFIGIYKESAHLLAALGMPERMTYDFTHYRGKRGVMLADIQTFLHAVALKLGVIIYTGAVARNLDAEVLRAGEIELHRYSSTSTTQDVQLAIGLTRWEHDSVARVASGVSVRFDTVVEATGGRSGLRELLVGDDCVVPLRRLGLDAAAIDPSLYSYFDPGDPSAELVRSHYPGTDLLDEFAEALTGDDTEAIPDELPGLVSNIDAGIFTAPIVPSGRSAGRGARIADTELEIPKDWVVVQCPLPDQTLTRYQIEGPLPGWFEYGDARISTADVLPSLNPVGLLLRVLYAMGVPFDAVDRRRLIDFYTAESSYGDATDIVATFVGAFRSLRLGGPTPLVWGNVAGSSLSYGIVGEAVQNAWYRFGVGVDDTFAGARRFGAATELDPASRADAARAHERIMLGRCVQVLFHLFLVARNTTQGVIGPVLTEYYLDERHTADLAEARLREQARQGMEILAARADLPIGDDLLDRAVDVRLDRCCQRVLGLLEEFSYASQLDTARAPLQAGDPDWRSQAAAVFGEVLTPAHLALVSPLFAPATEAANTKIGANERLVELARGRYPWVNAWLRACALRALDPKQPSARAALDDASVEADPLIAQTAAATLRGEPADATLIERVMILADVSIFRTIPHEVLAELAVLVSEREVPAGERVFAKGDLGDCLYVIAHGRVRVHDGDLTLNELGGHAFFGELSLLDAAPRSASVTAVAPTRLLRLSQKDFYALLSERVEIAHGVNRVLCEWIRRLSEAAPVAG